MTEKEVVDSLKQISGNLEAINKTLTDAKKIEDRATTNADVWKKRIKKLIGIVDSKCKGKFFTPRRIVVIIMVIVISIAISVSVILINNSAIDLIKQIAKFLPSDENQTLLPNGQLRFLGEQYPSVANLTIGVIAVLATLWALMLSFIFTPSTHKEIAGAYYSKLKNSEGVDAKDRPYLKALINMKCREFSLKLEDIYELNPDLFSEKSLLDNLYLK